MGARRRRGQDIGGCSKKTEHSTEAASLERGTVVSVINARATTTRYNHRCVLVEEIAGAVETPVAAIAGLLRVLQERQFIYWNLEEDEETGQWLQVEEADVWGVDDFWQFLKIYCRKTGVSPEDVIIRLRFDKLDDPHA